MARKRARRTYKSGSIVAVGSRWRVRWRIGSRRLSKTFATRELAEAALLSTVAAVARGEAGLPADRSKLTLRVLFSGPAGAPVEGGWIARRRITHRDARTDANRWKNHLAPAVGQMRPDEVDQAVLRQLVEDRIAAGKSTTTVRLIMRLLSTFFSDLVDDGLAMTNPVKQLPRRVRKLMKSAHDPKTTPFIERTNDIERLFRRLPEPINIALAVGALAGLRTGEVLALAMDHIDLEAGRIHVQVATKDGKLSLLKDDESRVVPIQNSLLPVLKAWKLKNRHQLVVPPMRKRGKFMRRSTLWKFLREAQKALGLPALTWYQSTRHTFASQWVLSGGELAQLRDVMGHSTVIVTERYAHLRPSDANRDRVKVDLSAPAGAVLSLHPVASAIGTASGPAAE